MTKRRPRYDGKEFTPEILDVYRRARKLYDDAPTWEALKQTEFPELQLELNVLLGRRAPWLHEIFDTIDDDAPPDWMKGEQDQGWHDAKQILTALEHGAK